MSERTVAGTYAGVLPSCACFEARVDGDLHPQTQTYLQASLVMGEQVARHLMSLGICPTAMPAMLMLVVSSAATELSAHLVREGEVQLPTDLTEDIRRTMEGVAALVPAELARIDAVALEASKTHGVAGTC